MGEDIWWLIKITMREELIHILCDFRSRYPHLRIILEPGSAFTWDTGCLVATVEDKVSNGSVDTFDVECFFCLSHARLSRNAL